MVTRCYWTMAQDDVSKILPDRATLRLFNKQLHDSIQFEKINVTTLDINEEMQRKINKIKKVRQVLSLIKSKKETFHFLATRNITQTQIKNRYTCKIFGLESESAGIQIPRMSVFLPQLEPYTFYKDHIIIAGSKYLNPLYNPGFYVFEQDTLGDKIVLQFKPKKRRGYLLYGEITLDLKTKQLRDMMASTVKGLKISVFYHAKLYNEIWMPGELETDITVGEQDDIIVVSTSRFEHYTKLNANVQFNSVLIDNQELLDPNHPRLDVLEPDSSVLINDEYDETVQLFESFLKTTKSQQLYDDLYKVANGKLPLKMVDVRLNKLVNFNPYEGFRPGLGIETNEDISEFWSVGGYAGYGFKDTSWKHSFNIDLNIDRTTNTKFRIEQVNDLTEPGEYRLPFSNTLFGNEGFRKFGLGIVDRNRFVGGELSTDYFKWLKLSVLGQRGFVEPLYEYDFAPLGGLSRYEYDRVAFTARIVPREKFIKAYKKYISLGSKFPTFWVNYEFGNVLNIPYQKFNFKAEKKFHFVVYGDFTVSLQAGWTNTDLPYSFLYNLHGSYRPGTPIINNSFMTMRYNEFLAQEFVTLHANHNFGKLHTNNETFKPEPILLHNMGFGLLRNPEKHTGLENVQSIEKGYFESGLYFRNLLAFKPWIGQVGIGAGFLYRYGPHRLDSFNNNLVFKFSLDLDL